MPAKPSRLRGLNLPEPRRLADDLARRYGIMGREALRLIFRLLLPAIERGNPGEIADALQAIDTALQELMGNDRIERDARKAGEMTNRQHSRLFFGALAATLGVRILGNDAPSTPIPELPGPDKPIRARRPRLLVRPNFQPAILVDQFVDENVRLVSTLRQGVVEALRDQIARESVLGTGDPAELAARLREQWERTGVPSQIPTRGVTRAGVPRIVTAESHATLIANDQIAKLNSQISRARMEAAGIEEGIWQTRKDSRVRPEHRALQGRKFDLDKGVNGTFPGMPINCRCWTQAVVDPDVVFESGGFIQIDNPPARGTVLPAGREFTRRGNPGIRPVAPGPGAAVGGRGFGPQ